MKITWASILGKLTPRQVTIVLLATLGLAGFVAFLAASLVWDIVPW